MAKLETVDDALLDELKDLYSAENQLLKALPKMAKKASNETLKEAFQTHLTETQGQVERLNKISGILGKKLSGKTCKAMEGLVKEAKEVLEEDSDNEALIDALLIGAAQRVEHYEMAAYGVAHAMAKALGNEEVSELLQETLEEETAADEKLTTICEEEVLPAALEGNEEEEEDGEEEDEGEEVEEEDEEEKKPARPAKSRSKTARSLTLFAFLGLAASHMHLATAETHEDRRKNEQDSLHHAADNTGRNARDVNDDRKTADDQALSGTETDLLAKVRRTIVENENLSTYAKNVKIIIDKGVVTLRGPVAKETEKQWIGEAVAKAAPSLRVQNELEVARS